MSGYNEYIFRMPNNTPDLDFDSLDAYIRTHSWFPYTNCGRYFKIGSTVTVIYRGPQRAKTAALPPAFDIRLYGVLIARIFPESVYFPEHHDAHMATGNWLGKIVGDNGIGSGVGRVRRRKNDPRIDGPRGLCGPLAINWDRNRLVEGHSYPVDHDRITHNRDYRERWNAEMKFRNEYPDTWAADLAATVPGGGMPDYRLPQPERAIEWAARQETAWENRSDAMHQKVEG